MIVNTVVLLRKKYGFHGQNSLGFPALTLLYPYQNPTETLPNSTRIYT